MNREVHVRVWERLRGRFPWSTRLKESLLINEARLAEKNILNNGFGRSHCLCHGDIGNLVILSNMSNLLNDDERNAAFVKINNTIWQYSQTREWRCGGPGSVETPGFMIGLSGIGYGLLYLSDPNKFPCILSLESPCRTRQCTGTLPALVPRYGKVQ